MNTKYLVTQADSTGAVLFFRMLTNKAEVSPDNDNLLEAIYDYIENLSDCDLIEFFFKYGTRVKILWNSDFLRGLFFDIKIEEYKDCLKHFDLWLHSLNDTELKQYCDRLFYKAIGLKIIDSQELYSLYETENMIYIAYNVVDNDEWINNLKKALSEGDTSYDCTISNRWSEIVRSEFLQVMQDINELGLTDFDDEWSFYLCLADLEFLGWLDNIRPSVTESLPNHCWVPYMKEFLEEINSSEKIYKSNPPDVSLLPETQWYCFGNLVFSDSGIIFNKENL